jgi:outer membrane protein assembly factor BamB
MRIRGNALRSGLLVWGLVTLLAGADWPQFRGPHGAGLAPDNDPLPADIGPKSHVLWQTPLPPGHSSPIVSGDRVFLTADRDGQLLTIALDRSTGKVLWEQEAPHKNLEAVHRIGSHAQSTPVADGERVISFFGSCGLFCYDYAGKVQWFLPMGPFNNDFGAGSSPIIVDNSVILCQDHDTNSFLLCLDKRTGKQQWKIDRSEFPRNFSTPAVWEVNGRKQIVVAATLRVIGYDLETGKEVWTVRGFSRVVTMTPVVGSDGILYAAGWAAGADSEDIIRLDAFDDVVKMYDKNADRQLQEKELPEEGPISSRFSQIDRDKSGGIDETEYNGMRRAFETAQNVILAVRPGGTGDITETHVLWRYQKMLPFCASPLFVNPDGKGESKKPPLLFLIRDGGILSTLNAKTGRPIKQRRLPATHDYYASPVCGDGKVYLLNEDGVLTVIKAEGEWEELATAEFGEPTYGTPALADGRIYLRTAGRLYCFGE